ncbi:MAG: hypothetical protein IJK52_12275, partial [Oscillospiraceae bacterium]|nr:hypothetical protein [Oscillospiraceae bacterium]
YADMNLTDTLSWVRRTMATRRHEVRSGHNADTDLRTTGYIRERGSDIMNPGFRTKKWLLLSWIAGRIEPERSQLYEEKRIHAR